MKFAGKKSFIEVSYEKNSRENFKEWYDKRPSSLCRG